MENCIDVRDLRKNYRSRFRKETQALKGVTLSVAPGQIFGLLGQNGAGKTTLVKVLLGLCRASGGSAQLLGAPAGDPHARRRVGYQPEEARIPGYHTGATALEFYARMCGVRESAKSKRVREILDTVGLGERGDTKVRQYSKGMRQRLCLAQALVHDPDVLFLDEPTDGLDPLGRRQIRDLLLGLKARGKTVFLNSHLLSEVEQICDRVVVLHKGELLAEGTIQELTRASLSYEIGLDAAPDGAIELLRAQGIETRAGDRSLAVELKEEAQIDGVIDLLRGRKIGIRSVVPKRRSLEDVFVGMVDAVKEKS